MTINDGNILNENQKQAFDFREGVCLVPCGSWVWENRNTNTENC